MTRDEFIPRFSLEYMQRHPEVGIRYAKRQARQRWRKRMERQAVQDLVYRTILREVK